MTTTVKFPKKRVSKEKSARPAPKEKNIARVLELFRSLPDDFMVERENDLPKIREEL